MGGGARGPFRRVLDSGETVEDLEVAAPTAADPGRDHTWLATWYPVRHDGEIVAVGVFVTDITARVRAERGLQLLFDVGEALDATLGVEERLARLAALVVPTLGDFCTIEMLEASGEARLLAGAPLPEAADADPDRLIAVPLRARGRQLGTLTLRMGPSGRRYDDADRVLALQLGRRAGLAVDNARLYDAQLTIADTLQRSLLPPALPEIPGLEAAARYSPMGDGVEVGGDFYDLFAAGRSWVAVIGDVCGKGVEAAALTSLVRHSVRALAREDPAPRAALERLNETIIAERGLESRFSTVAYVRLAPGERGVAATVSSAGHPRAAAGPRRRAGGAARPAGHPAGPVRGGARPRRRRRARAGRRARALHGRGHRGAARGRDVRRGPPAGAAERAGRAARRRDRAARRGGGRRPPRRPARRRPRRARAEGARMSRRRRDPAWLWYGLAAAALLALLLLDLTGVLGGLGP